MHWRARRLRNHSDVNLCCNMHARQCGRTAQTARLAGGLLQEGRQQLQSIGEGCHKLLHHLSPSLRPHSWPIAPCFLQGSSGQNQLQVFCVLSALHVEDAVLYPAKHQVGTASLQ